MICNCQVHETVLVPIQQSKFYVDLEVPKVGSRCLLDDSHSYIVLLPFGTTISKLLLMVVINS